MKPKKGQGSREPYVKLEHRMLNTAAWTSLSFGAVWVYIELRKSFDSKKGGDDHLVLTYPDVRWKMNSRTFSVKKKELVDKGFIRLVKQGGLLKNPSIYALSNDWERISREIVHTEGREAVRAMKKKYPRKQPPALKEYIENHKKKHDIPRNI